MSVVDDAAERGAKFSSDLVTSSRNEDTYQDNISRRIGSEFETSQLSIVQERKCCDLFLFLV